MQTFFPRLDWIVFLDLYIFKLYGSNFLQMHKHKTKGNAYSVVLKNVNKNNAK